MRTQSDERSQVKSHQMWVGGCRGCINVFSTSIFLSSATAPSLLEGLEVSEGAGWIWRFV